MCSRYYLDENFYGELETLIMALGAKLQMPLSISPSDIHRAMPAPVILRPEEYGRWLADVGALREIQKNARWSNCGWICSNKRREGRLCQKLSLLMIWPCQN